MHTATVTLMGISAFQYSRYHAIPKKDKENDQDHEDRTWLQRAHVNPQGQCFIPAMAFKKSLEIAAKYASKKIKGKGNATYSKHFLSGVLVMNPLVLPYGPDELEKLTLFVPSNGQRGGGKRVKKHFPVIPEGKWGGNVEYIILDETVTESVFSEVIENAGQFIGVGAFRPENGGYFGRYVVEKIKWD